MPVACRAGRAQKQNNHKECGKSYRPINSQAEDSTAQTKQNPKSILDIEMAVLFIKSSRRLSDCQLGSALVVAVSQPNRA